MSKIKELRIAAGMTQKELGEEFGIPRRTIENWEGEQRACPEYVINLIEECLKSRGKIRE
jgi:DNA-binding XRE family transcriptional regulator